MIASATDRPRSSITNSSITCSSITADPTALDLLVAEVLRLSDHRGSTPVLVTPSYLSLRLPFFVSLAAAIRRQSGRALRIDWYRPGFGLAERLAEPLARRFVGKLNVAFGDRAQIEITSSIGRPGGAQRELVVGYCREPADLPPWATPIQLSAPLQTARP